MSEGKLRPVGYSDKVFYYNGSGENSTYDFRMRVYLNEKPDPDKLKEAASRAVRRFPEYAVRPVIKDNLLYYEENEADVAVFPEDGTSHVLGSDETNGYLWCILYGERDIVVSYYHGLSDFPGNWSLICTVIYEYGLLSGLELTPAAPVRISAQDYYRLEESERTDPYTKYENRDSVPSFVYESRGALKVTEDMYESGRKELRYYECEFPLKDFLQRTKELGVSFVPLITAIIAEAIEGLYPDDDKPVVAKIPVNLRQVYGSETTVNFSDSCILECGRKDTEGDIATLCAGLKESMKLQIRKENFDRILHKKRATIVALEETGRPIAELAAEITSITDAGPRPVTYALTYPGKLDMPEELRAVASGVNMEPYMPTAGVFITLGSYDDVLRMRYTQRFESDRLVNAVCEALGKQGITAVLRDSGYVYPDTVLTEKLKHY
ncbi:MAG: hypothetical protein IKI75_00055 [Lachnospiraceae bacterium]|nr:hypothetical protein [Lachnospiraceae bacterium]